VTVTGPVQGVGSNRELAPEVERFYSETFDESERLTTAADGRLELLRTQELLRRYLPPAPAKILDVGGGPGVHAKWLVADGYEVDLIDPVARHVEQASSICRASIGDARHLDAADDTYDVVLLLGPLSTTCLIPPTAGRHSLKLAASYGQAAWWPQLRLAATRPSSNTQRSPTCIPSACKPPSPKSFAPPPMMAIAASDSPTSIALTSWPMN
jgi:hypothetical protein